MSDRAKALIDRMTNDEAFRKRVLKAGDQNAQKAVLEDAGFGDVSPEDIQAAMPSDVELSDEELEAVAGGRTVEWVGAGAGVVGASVAAGAAAA